MYFPRTLGSPSITLTAISERAFGTVFIALILFPLVSVLRDRNALVYRSERQFNPLQLSQQRPILADLLPPAPPIIPVHIPEMPMISADPVKVIPVVSVVPKVTIKVESKVDITNGRTDWCKRKEASIYPICSKSSASSTRTLRLAYGQYATTPQYLCNSIMIFTELRRVKTEAELALIYPEDWNNHVVGAETHNSIAKLLLKAKALGVNLYPTKILSKSSGDPTWSESFTKLKILELVDYDRIIHLDSDGMVLKNMDHLFFEPLAEIAIPKAYWLNAIGSKNPIYSSQFMMIMPSQSLYAKMLNLFNTDTTGGFDMEIMNTLAGDGKALILPHQTFDMVSGEFRTDDHTRYFEGSPEKVWDADAEAARSHYIHFSDWPLRKPWFSDEQTAASVAPKCPPNDPCRNRVQWYKLYNDFKALDREVCES